jgi:hypothetical protein
MYKLIFIKAGLENQETKMETNEMEWWYGNNL